MPNKQNSFSNKHVGERLDYTVDFSKALSSGEKITTATWEATGGVAVDEIAVDTAGRIVSAWMSGGNGSMSFIVVKATTTTGRVFVEKIVMTTYS